MMGRAAQSILLGILAVVCVGCSSGPRVISPTIAEIAERNRHLKPDRPVRPDELEGEATWYGERHHGNLTANGESFDMDDFTAAHRTLPFNTIVRVTDTDSRRSVVVRINDRGPGRKHRVIDLSRAAASDLGLIDRGKTQVSLDILVWGDGQTFHHL